MSEQHRRVALRLSRLSSRDRNWMLSQLGEDDRPQIAAYLEELNSFELDEETLSALEAAESRASAQGSVEMECPLDPLLVRQALSKEPAWVTQALIIDPSVRRAVGDVSFSQHESPVTPQAQAALRGMLVHRVETLRVQQLSRPTRQKLRENEIAAPSLWTRIQRLWHQ